MRPKTRGRWMVVSAALMWSLGGVLAKSIPLDGMALAADRSLIAGLILLPAIRPGRWTVKPGMIPLAVIFAAMIGCYLSAIKATTAANAIYLQSSAIAWTIPIAAIWLGEAVDRRSALAIGLATVGVAMIVAWGWDPTRPLEGRGVALGLASGVGYALVMVGLRRYRDVDSTWLAAYCNLAGGTLLALWIVAVGGSSLVPPAASWPLLIAFGVIQMGIPYVLFSMGLREISAPEAALLSLIEPALSPIWVWLRHGESPAPATLVGGSILLLGVAIRYLPARRGPEPIRAE